jgi:hypothetical protein
LRPGFESLGKTLRARLKNEKGTRTVKDITFRTQASTMKLARINNITVSIEKKSKLKMMYFFKEPMPLERELKVKILWPK